MVGHTVPCSLPPDCRLMYMARFCLTYQSANKDVRDKFFTDPTVQVGSSGSGRGGWGVRVWGGGAVLVLSDPVSHHLRIAAGRPCAHGGP